MSAQVLVMKCKRIVLCICNRNFICISCFVLNVWFAPRYIFATFIVSPIYIYYNRITVSSVECSALLMTIFDRLSIDHIKADIRDINCHHIGRHLQSITSCYRYIGDQNRQSMQTYSTKNWDWVYEVEDVLDTIRPI